MAETAAGGWVTRAATSAASTRPSALREPDLLAAERTEGGDDARAGFGDREHQRAL